MNTTLLIDGHVHYHAPFGVARFLEAATSNFAAGRSEVGHSEALGCLMLSESSWHHFFRAVGSGLVEREAPGWSVTATGEEDSLFISKDGESTLLLIAGRQIVTAERLEVLALATNHQYPDGLRLGAAIEQALASGAVPVLPWGFGKWTGKRGRLLAEILTSSVGEHVFLGDNGGRPALSLRPTLFRLADARGIPILPGSDPLPLRAEVSKPGRYGFVLEGRFERRSPAAAIRAILATRPNPSRFGRLEHFRTFLTHQAALRLNR